MKRTYGKRERRRRIQEEALGPLDFDLSRGHLRIDRILGAILDLENNTEESFLHILERTRHFPVESFSAHSRLLVNRVAMPNRPYHNQTKSALRPLRLERLQTRSSS